MKQLIITKRLVTDFPASDAGKILRGLLQYGTIQGKDLYIVTAIRSFSILDNTLIVVADSYPVRG